MIISYIIIQYPNIRMTNPRPSVTPPISENFYARKSSKNGPSAFPWKKASLWKCCNRQ